jgi:serpin B
MGRLMGMRSLERRSLLRLAGGLAGAAIAMPALAACAEGVTGLDLVGSRVPRRTVPAARARAASAAVDALATTLYEGLPGTGNLVYSPLSVAVALAMVAVGARGATRRQLSALLGSPAAGIDEAFNALTRHLSSERVPGRGIKPADQPVVALADALFGQEGLTFGKAFLDVLATEYGAGMAVVDFEDDPGGATRRIDRWVGEQTHRLIPRLIPDGVLTELTRLVLVNAVYLKAAWWRPFDAPRPGTFHRPDGSTVRVPMLSGGPGAEVPGHRGDGYRTARLGYLARDLAMTLIVPDEGRFADVEGVIRRKGVRALLEGRGSTYALTMPSFRMRTSAELAPLFAAAGAPVPFSDDADFTGITRDTALSISNVVHQAVVDVDRNGTVAAAATAVVASASSAHRPPPDLVADRPFWFVVHDTTYSTPIFVGRVTDPIS